jgi:hypothetical protein
MTQVQGKRLADKCVHAASASWRQASWRSSKTIAKPTFSSEEKIQLPARKSPLPAALGRNLGNKGKKQAKEESGRALTKIVE